MLRKHVWILFAVVGLGFVLWLSRARDPQGAAPAPTSAVETVTPTAPQASPASFKEGVADKSPRAGAPEVNSEGSVRERVAKEFGRAIDLEFSQGCLLTAKARVQAGAKELEKSPHFDSSDAADLRRRASEALAAVRGVLCQGEASLELLATQGSPVSAQVSFIKCGRACRSRRAVTLFSILVVKANGFRRRSISLVWSG